MWLHWYTITDEDQSPYEIYIFFKNQIGKVGEQLVLLNYLTGLYCPCQLLLLHKTYAVLLSGTCARRVFLKIPHWKGWQWLRQWRKPYPVSSMLVKDLSFSWPKSYPEHHCSYLTLLVWQRIACLAFLLFNFIYLFDSQISNSSHSWIKLYLIGLESSCCMCFPHSFCIGSWTVCLHVCWIIWDGAIQIPSQCA